MTTSLRAFALAAAAASTLAAFPASADLIPTPDPAPPASPPPTTPAPAGAPLPPPPYPVLPPGYAPPAYGAPLGAYTPPHPAMERRSIPLIVGGTGVLLAGTGMFAGAIVELMEGICISLGFGPSPSACRENHTPAVLGLIVGGLVALAAGIPMVVVGAKRVPVNADAHAVLERKGLPRWAGAPGGRGWEWRF